MIRLIPENIYFDFMSRSKVAMSFSLIAIVASIILVSVVGLNFGIDFKGGTDMILKFDKDITAEQVRDAAIKAGFADASVQSYGVDGQQFLVQTATISVVDKDTVAKIETAVGAVSPLERAIWSDEQPDRLDLIFKTATTAEQIQQTVTPIAGDVVVEENKAEPGLRFVVRFEDLQVRVAESFTAQLPGFFAGEDNILRLETVGPRAGKQLRDSGILSLFVSLLLILIYIAFRFDIRYAPGAVLSLAHDVTIALGFFVIIDLEISLPIIAALLTIIGYSLNDTIVVFDRIRELLTNDGDGNPVKTVNQAISDTLSRTLMTSLTTLLAVFAIIMFGSGLIADFATALFIGITVGTFSSIFVASPVMLFMDRYLRTRRELKARNEAAV